MADKHAEGEEEYREQTEEDLKNVPPMSSTQKAVLIIAALFIVFFVITSIL